MDWFKEIFIPVARPEEQGRPQEQSRTIYVRRMNHSNDGIVSEPIATDTRVWVVHGKVEFVAG